MAKGKKSPTPKGLGKSPEPTVADEVVKKVTDLKAEGNTMFAQKEWAKAIEQYESAMKMLPAGHVERSDLLCNKAACLMGLNRYKDAVKECNSALESTPSSTKALRSRAKALEKQGLYKQALADIQAVNRSDGVNDDSREAEKRLKDLLAGRRPSLANGGARAAAAPNAAGRGARSPSQWPFNAKVTVGNETRLVQLSATSGYADLLAGVASKFPNAGPVVLKYVDREGDLVTITSRNDLQAAFTEALQNMDRRLGMVIPPIKVTATPVASKAEVPPVPMEELAETRLMQQQLAAQQAAAQQAAAAQQQQQQQKQTAQAYPSGEVIEIDDWLVDIIQMIKDAAGIDPDKHIDIQNEGYAALQRATDTAVRSEEALPLFDRAAARFQEVAASGYVQWGNVHQFRAHRAMDVAALADSPWSKELEASVKKEFDAAEGLFKKALEVKTDFFDAYAHLAALEFDRAKAAAKMLSKPPAPVEADAAAAGGDDAAVNKAAQEAALAATKEALAKVKAADVKAASKHIGNATNWYKKAKTAAEAADAERKAAAEQRSAGKADSSSSSDSKQQPEAAAAAKGQQQPQQEGVSSDVSTTLTSHCQVLHGNSLYEWSQMLAAAGDASWRGVLDEATELFRGAGCADKDIRGALKNHTEADKLDLGPEPEPEPEPEPAAPTPAAPAAEAGAGATKQQHKAAPEAKGLPKLERKPKDKAAAAQ